MTMNDFMEKYLGEVDRRLRRLPVAERVDIVNELKSEIAELVSGGMTPEQIVARLGSAKELAGGYLGDAIARSPRFTAMRALAGLSSCRSPASALRPSCSAARPAR